LGEKRCRRRKLGRGIDGIGSEKIKELQVEIRRIWNRK
jgi:hypothetical protein